MKKRKIVVGIILIVTAGGVLITMPIGGIRTVDFLKVLALGAGLGVLISQLLNDKT